MAHPADRRDRVWRHYCAEVGRLTGLARLDGSCRLALTEDDVNDSCRGQIARFKIPAFAGIVDRGRLTASAKVQRRTLREMAARRRPEPSA